MSELAARCRANLPLLSSKRLFRTFSRDSALAQAVPSLPEMTHFGVGLDIIYSCDVSLPSCYLEWKAVLGPALLGSFQTTTVTITEFAIESGTRSLKCSYFSFCVIKRWDADSELRIIQLTRGPVSPSNGSCFCELQSRTSRYLIRCSEMYMRNAGAASHWSRLGGLHRGCIDQAPLGGAAHL